LTCKERPKTVFIILQGSVSKTELKTLFDQAMDKLTPKRTQFALETSSLEVSIDFLKDFRSIFDPLLLKMKDEKKLEAFYLVDNRKPKEDRHFNLFKMACSTLSLKHGIKHESKALIADIPT
jgi:hypothetical protein